MSETSWSPESARPLDAIDGEVAMLLARGDCSGAISTLIRSLGRRIYKICNRMLGDQAAAEDAYQDTFMQVYESIRTGHIPRSICAWALTIARHRCLDALKVGRRRRDHHERFDTIPELPAPELSCDDQLAQKDLMETIQGFLDSLDPEVRMPFILRYQEGYSFKEMEQICGARASALHMRVMRALHELRDYISDAGPGAFDAVALRVQEWDASKSAGSVGLSTDMIDRSHVRERYDARSRDPIGRASLREHEAHNVDDLLDEHNALCALCAALGRAALRALTSGCSLPQVEPRPFWETERIGKSEEARIWIRELIGVTSRQDPDEKPRYNSRRLNEAFERFANFRLLAQGERWSTFVTWDRGRRCDVVLKVMNGCDDADVRELFNYECDAIQSSANGLLVPLLDYGEVAIVRPNGSTLHLWYTTALQDRSLRAELPRLDLSQRARIAQRLLDALAHMHSIDVPHRDVKPDSVFLVGGDASLGDFGISSIAAENRFAPSGDLARRRAYMAPECWQSTAHAYTESSDQYAAGVTIYEVLSRGCAPLSYGATIASCEDAHREQDALHLTIPELNGRRLLAISQVIRRMMAKAPTDRYPSMGLCGQEFIAALSLDGIGSAE